VLKEIPRLEKRRAIIKRKLLSLVPGRKEYRLQKAKLRELTQTLRRLAERRKDEILWPRK